MGYAITRYGGKNGRPADWFEFVVDEAEDLTSLPPAAAGSVAYCSGDGKNYIMSVSGSWAEKQSSGGGSGSGSGLPDVTSSDNGKVLTVVNGDWGVADAGGGAFVVTATFSESGGSLDKSYNDFVSAIQAGRPIVCYVEYNTFEGYSATIFTNIDHNAGLAYPYSVTFASYNRTEEVWFSTSFGATTPTALLTAQE